MSLARLISASGLRFLDFRRWLVLMVEEHEIDEVYFERVYRHLGTDAAHVFGAFMYTLTAVCEEFHVKCSGIPVGTIKKFATGKGNATKEEMIAFAKSQGFRPIDDNEADALAILFLSLKSYDCQKLDSATGPSSHWERAAQGGPKLR